MRFRRRGRRGAAARRAQRVLHVRPKDQPVRAGAGQLAQVEAVLPGQPADQGRDHRHGPVVDGDTARVPVHRAGGSTGRRRCGHAGPAARGGPGPPVPGGAGTCATGRGRRGGTRHRPSRPDPAAPRGRLGRAVTDEDVARTVTAGTGRTVTARTGQALAPGTRRGAGTGSGRAARAGSGGTPRTGPGRPVGAGVRAVAGRRPLPHRHRDQRGPDGQLLALLAEAGRDHAAVGAGHLDHRLGRLDLDDRLVDGDHVTDLDQPAHDLRLGEPLSEVGQLELQHLCHQLSASHCRRPTASRIRSTPGRW